MESSSADFKYVYLDFNEKLTPNIFANKVFLRVANLHKPNPLVQINDLVFKGTHDECVGTNLFFEEIEDPPPKSNIYEKETAISLEPVAKQTKIIRLKQMKLPKKVPSTQQTQESVTLNLNQEYSAVLEKLEQGLLNIEDIALKEPEQEIDEDIHDTTLDTTEEFPSEPEKEQDTFLHLTRNKNSPPAILEAKYERLKRLARRPVKRIKSPELVAECDPQYKDAYEYNNLERQMLQSSDAFRSTYTPILQDAFVGGVDIDRCVLHGLLKPSDDLTRTLTKEEQSKVFTIENFENLSIPARYLILKQCVKQIETLIENTTSEELKETDDNGRTVKDFCDIFRKLVKRLEEHMAQSSNGVNVKDKFEVVDRPPYDYVKYKYNPGEKLFDEPDIFNEDKWIDAEKKDELDQGENKSQDSSGEDSNNTTNFE